MIKKQAWQNSNPRNLAVLTEPSSSFEQPTMVTSGVGGGPQPLPESSHLASDHLHSRELPNRQPPTSSDLQNSRVLQTSHHYSAVGHSACVATTLMTLPSLLTHFNTMQPPTQPQQPQNSNPSLCFFSSSYFTTAATSLATVGTTGVGVFRFSSVLI